MRIAGYVSRRRVMIKADLFHKARISTSISARYYEYTDRCFLVAATDIALLSPALLRDHPVPKGASGVDSVTGTA